MIENVILDIDGNMWHLNNGVCLAEPRSINGFGATIREAVADFKREIRPSVIGNLPLDLKPFKEDPFVGIVVADSVNTARIGYSHRLNLLLLEVTDGKKYHYQDVPVEVWRAFLISDHKGKYLAEKIRGHFRYYQAYDELP